MKIPEVYKLTETEPAMGQGRNKEINDFSEFNENEGTTYPNPWDTMKTVLREKFIALNVYLKKLDKPHTSTLKEHKNTLEH